MPALPPMGCNELAELELESVALSAAHHHHHQHHQPGLPTAAAAAAAAAIKQPKPRSAAARKQPKIEALDPSSPPAHHDHNKLGVRSNAKFKKPMLSPGHASGWLAMMETDAAGFLLGHHQQQQQCEPQQQQQMVAGNAATSTAGAAKSEKSGKNSSGAAKAESSTTRKYYPAPFCSCTGTNQQCYRWGNGGWQSACCTTKISMYPLPMNPKKKGSRVAGRKMSAGAFMKLLDRLTAEGVDVNSSVDLRPHWAKHGTNRYVTIK